MAVAQDVVAERLSGQGLVDGQCVYVGGRRAGFMYEGDVACVFRQGQFDAFPGFTYRSVCAGQDEVGRLVASGRDVDLEVCQSVALVGGRGRKGEREVFGVGCFDRDDQPCLLSFGGVEGLRACIGFVGCECPSVVGVLPSVFAEGCPCLAAFRAFVLVGVGGGRIDERKDYVVGIRSRRRGLYLYGGVAFACIVDFDGGFGRFVRCAAVDVHRFHLIGVRAGLESFFLEEPVHERFVVHPLSVAIEVVADNALHPFHFEEDQGGLADALQADGQ